MVLVLDATEARRDLAAQLVRLEWHRAAVQPEDPRGELGQIRVVRDERVVLDVPRVSEGPFDPPGRVAAHADASRPDRLADLPPRRQAVVIGVEVRREAEVALASRREANVPANPRDAEGPDLIRIVVAADHVPRSLVRQQREGIHGPLARLVPRDRPVLELHRPLLGDRALELAEPPRHLRGVVGIADFDPYGRLRRCLAEARTAEREVLERESERL